ncbi:unnamed protein product [Kuraishia capsulata CBS 1993]|uniref:Uncharacterized protein n=1 Tax=Kuraishia capsulata CBS 1993 TaxID=1382522 RepID=W6MU84_9ASCO|nr:uncharacterized protein KUCA_T00004953001 [Kuraishia capsulata CBS 1993]CDK28967.1 unnamed protein product [Kuraishia capsulata CBS 1993]
MPNNQVDEEAFAFPSSHDVVQPSAGKGLNLSGRIINAMTTLPDQIYKTEDGSWNVKHVRGNSALYASNYFLSQHTQWETHLVAWTGELYAYDEVHPRAIPTSQLLESDPLYLSEEAKVDVTQKLRKASNTENIHPVWLLRKDQTRWRKYAENVIWPILHYMQNKPSDGREETEWWHDYVKFNEAYAAKIKEIYKPGDIIWIHDYYLLLLPQIIRMEIPDAKVGLFLHVPFPSSEYFRCLSKRTLILNGMLSANQIGFQAYSFSRHFISCCARLLGCEVSPTSITSRGFHVGVIVEPLGIDTAKIENDAFTSSVEEKVLAIKELNLNRKIIIGRDRLDTVRGVVQKLQAFEMFLSMYPEWRKKVVMIQVSFPSFYHSAKLEKQVSELIANINGKYGTLDFIPVQHYEMRVAKDEYLALLRVADLGLITCVRDGMNTTALEYVVCQKKTNSPLILSEFSGTVTVLGDAIQVNPWDSVGVANAINECLLMPSSTKASLEQKLYAQVTNNTIQDWTSKFILHLLGTLKNTQNVKGTPYLNKPLVLNNYNAAHRRLFLFDYDGTLTPIVKEPSAAIPSARLQSLLQKITSDPKNELWIISGRDQQFLEKWIASNNPNVGLSAEHGCFMKVVGAQKWINLAESFDMSWQKEVAEVFQQYTERTPGSFIERKKVALTWHHRKADPEFGEYQASKCKQQLDETVAKKYDVEVMVGKANIEVRPKFVNKGEIVKRLILHTNPTSGEMRTVSELPDFMMCMGDDLTDEDMFNAMNGIEQQWVTDARPSNAFGTYGVYTISVGPANKPTCAKAYLSDPQQVMDTLGLLLGEVSLFETAGTVELDDRGHLKDSQSSQKSQETRKLYETSQLTRSLSKQ